MQTNIPVEKKRQVLAFKALPTRLTGIHLTLMYVLYSQVFNLPLWADVVAGVSLLVLVVMQAIHVGQEQQINPFK